MNLLDGIELPIGLVWSDELDFTGVRSIVTETLGGRPIVFEDEVEGRPITLTGQADEGWIKRSVLLQLFALARVPRAVYTLVYNGVSYNVRFRNEDSGGPIGANPIVGRQNQQPDDYYNNVILKFMEV